MYVVVNDVPTYWPVVEKLGFRPLPDSGAVLDGTEYASVVLDFGPGSVDGWLASLVADELGIEEDPELDEEARELAVDGKPVPLTPLEYGLFRQLREREGKTVTRRDLLREAGGTEFAGGSNVVDAAVRSLRRKLGAGGARRRDRARQRLPPAPRLARAPELELSPNLHQAFIERVGGASYARST